MKVYFKTLGCEKNTVDSEFAAGLLIGQGFSIAEDPDDADVIIVNTCGFIDDAKRQSIETIFELLDARKPGQRIFAAGCMAQRYGKELHREIPELDGILGVNDYVKLPEMLKNDGFSLEMTDHPDEYEELGSRMVEGRCQPWTASIKIAEGCDKHCTYCAIPMMRGRYRSRKPEAVISEARALVASGARELVVIAQDVSYYGKDLKKPEMLPQLLRELCKIEDLKWLRLMYCYEEEITDGLIQVIKEEPKICKYIDIPLQHASDKILKAMNRRSTADSIRSTIKKLRKEIPGIIIRTTFITGFPGETKKEFRELYDFVAETGFDRMGVFAYSREEGTPAYKMPHQVKQDAKERRRDRLMALQNSISLQHNQKFVGQTLEVLVEEKTEDGSYLGRTAMDAPEIDNGVIFSSHRELTPGQFVQVVINDAFDYDLSGYAL
ncbi:MAG: 30S ribosomal protein S12 methylthiotransferase RimO [Firmicutes bacterium]|nr:30S ribosomal protein S12 methylthiotransferase RimO [Bacillota bacterium]